MAIANNSLILINGVYDKKIMIFKQKKSDEKKIVYRMYYGKQKLRGY